jgi:DNA-binding LacI/PurR family transcriptional regulator
MIKRASITDVAKRAGVSISTVSLVMNNRPNVSPETAKVVRDSARELGYQPGGGPGKKRGPKPGPRHSVLSRQIGVVLSGFPDAILRDGVCTALIQGIVGICSAQGFQAVPIITSDTEQIRALIRHSRFDGLLVIGQPENGRLDELFSRIPTVQILGIAPDQSGWDHVGFDGLEVARRVCQALADNGCKTCWYLGLGRFAYNELAACFEVESHQFELAFRNLARREFFEIGPTGPVFACDVLAESICPLLEDPGPGPVGIFAENAALALAFESQLQTFLTNGRPPVQAIIADSAPCCLRGLPRFRGFVDMHVGDMARQGVEQLLWRINHRNEPRTRRLVPVTVSPQG